MLSNKLTFSLVFLVMFAILAAPVMAQLTDTYFTPGAAPADTKSLGGFEVLTNSATLAASVGISDTTGYAALNNSTLNLYDLLRNGGTIELQALVNGTDAAARTNATNIAKGAASNATDAEKKLSVWQHLIISEVMWGMNTVSGSPTPTNQWVEIYHNKALSTDVTALLNTNADQRYRIVFYPGQKTANSKNPAQTVTADGPDVVIETDFGLPNSDGDDNADNDADDALWVLVDRVSAVDQFSNQWTLKGQSGNAVVETGEAGIAQKDVISMYRKRDLTDDKSKYKDDKSFGSGIEAGSWEASAQSSNVNAGFVATPGGVHRITVGGIVPQAKAAVTAVDNGGAGIIFNEIRNDIASPPNQVDWIELYNNSASGTDPIGVGNWQIQLIREDPAGGTAHTLDVIAEIPANYSIPAGETLLIVGEDPSRTHLSRGFNVGETIGRDEMRKGAQHAFVMDSRMVLPDTGKFLLVLRSGNDKGADNLHEKLVDFAGDGFFAQPGITNIYPLRGHNPPGIAAADFGDGTATFATTRNDRSYGRKSELVQDVAGERVYRPKSRGGGDRLHNEDWVAFGAGATAGGHVERDVSGIGYDPMTNPRNAPGSPGYGNHGGINTTFHDNNNSKNTDDYDFKGMVTISEIMYDAGEAWNLVQWIELFNNSMDQAVDLSGWELEIRNRTDAQSYVDASITFDDDTIIGPNQTLLIVADEVGAASRAIPRSRIYNLYAKHRRELGLLRRHGTLLSRTAFYVRLTASQTSVEGNRRQLQEQEIMDEAGNLMGYDAKGNFDRETIVWDLPAREEDNRRRSLVREYEDNNGMGSQKTMAEGLMEAAWRTANEGDLSRPGGAGSIYFGHSLDIGTPGYSRVSPLPVSLSSFRPVRDKATGEVVIRWVTQSELNNAGFNILRSETKTGEFQVVNLKGIIPGHGTTSEKHVYEWTDTTAKPNVVYYYQIEDVSLDGKRTTLVTTHLRGNVNAAGKLTTTWSSLKTQN